MIPYDSGCSVVKDSAFFGVGVLRDLVGVERFPESMGSSNLPVTPAMDGTVRMWNWRAGDCLRVLGWCGVPQLLIISERSFHVVRVSRMLINLEAAASAILSAASQPRNDSPACQLDIDG